MASTSPNTRCGEPPPPHRLRTMAHVICRQARRQVSWEMHAHPQVADKMGFRFSARFRPAQHTCLAVRHDGPVVALERPPHNVRAAHLQARARACSGRLGHSSLPTAELTPRRWLAVAQARSSTCVTQQYAWGGGGKGPPCGSARHRQVMSSLMSHG